MLLCVMDGGGYSKTHKLSTKKEEMRGKNEESEEVVK